jgi:hypothetical protein
MAYRKLRIIDGKTPCKIGDIKFKHYQYTIGVHGVKIKGEDIKSVWVTHYDILGMTREAYIAKINEFRFDDDYCACSCNIAITPYHVKQYITEKLKG